MPKSARMLAAVPFLFLVACAVEPPASNMEKQARLAAAAELASQSCAGYLGGYGDARTLRKDADASAATARSLGATDAVMQKARLDVETAFNGAVFLAGAPAACNELVSSIAWESS